MKSNPQSRWNTDSRLDRQNAVHPDGWSRLPGDSSYDDDDSLPSRRPAPRSWLRTLALPLALCLTLGSAVIYLMTTLAAKA